MKWMTIVLTCYCFASYGQDYLVTNKGDTLRGKVKIMSYDKMDRLQITEGKNKTIFTALQVKEAFIDGAVFHPRPADSGIRYMMLMKKGYLSYYGSRDEGQNHYNGRYLVKKDGHWIELPNLTFKKTMADFLADDPELRDKLKNGDYGKKDLYPIIDSYNTYIDSITAVRQNAGFVKTQAVGKVESLSALKKTLQAQGDFDSKLDALDLIDDIVNKVNAGQAIPNFLLDGLQKYLAGNEGAKGDLDRAIAALKE